MLAFDLTSAKPTRLWEAKITREDAFRDFLIGQSLAPETTVRNYLLRYRQAVVWCHDHQTTLDRITATELAQMMRTIQRTQYTRIGQLRATLNRYWIWTGRHNPPIGAIRLPPQPNYPNRALQPDHARMLAKVAADTPPQGLAVNFGLFMALRCSEIAMVQWSRFNPDLTVYTVTGKNSSTHTLPVHPQLRSELEQTERKNDWLFPGRAGRQYVTPNTIWNWANRLSEQAGIGKLGGVHVLRHTCLTRLYEQTRDLYLVQRFARHKDPKQTAHYVMQDFGSMQSAVASIGYDG